MHYFIRMLIVILYFMISNIEFKFKQKQWMGYMYTILVLTVKLNIGYHALIELCYKVNDVIQDNPALIKGDINV